MPTINEKLFLKIRNVTRDVATEAIPMADLATLVAAQESRLAGDWRRAAVAKRIKQLEKQPC